MRAVGKGPQGYNVASDLQEPGDSGDTVPAPSVNESNSDAALQMQLQVINQLDPKMLLYCF
jgi:hypothetical protein